MIIRTPQQFAANRMAENVRESFQSIGEEFIFISTWHTFSDDPDDEQVGGQFPRCPRCWDDDYQQSTDLDCPLCLGSGLAPNDTSGGIKHFGRVFGVISDDKSRKELLRKYGEWNADDRDIQMEAIYPEPQHHDFMVRVEEWSSDHRPLVLGSRYRIQDPDPYTIRTGNQYGQSAKDIIGYGFKASMIKNYRPQHVFDFNAETPIARYNG